MVSNCHNAMHQYAMPVVILQIIVLIRSSHLITSTFTLDGK